VGFHRSGLVAGQGGEAAEFRRLAGGHPKAPAKEAELATSGIPHLVSRSSYVDRRLVEKYEHGEIAGSGDEKAVLDLLTES